MPTNADVTQVSVETTQAPATKNANVTQLSVEVLRPSSDLVAVQQVTQVSVEEATQVGPTISVLKETQLSVEVLLNQVPVIKVTTTPMMLIDTLTHRGPTPWSTYSKFPVVGGVPSGVITIKEVQFVDPITGKELLGVLASFADGKVYQLFGGTQDGSVLATAITWPLPDLTQLPIEDRDTMKVFRELWVEGVDLGNWILYWSTDGKLASDPTKVYSPGVPLQNRNQIGVNGRQIVLKFTHEAPSDFTPLLSYMKLNYDIVGKAAGAQGAGQNY